MKSFARILILSLLCGLPLLVRAQTLPHTISFDGISFAFDPTLGTSLNIYRSPGDPPDTVFPDGSHVPHTEFLFYDDDNPPGLHQTDARLLVYNVSDIVDYRDSVDPIVYERFEALAALITDQHDLSAYEVAGSESAQVLPHLPILLMPQVLRARVQYWETDALKGIRYLTAYSADSGRPLVTGDFVYAFMGLSRSGSVLVAGSFGVAPDGYWTTFPPEDETLMDDFYAHHGGMDAFESAYDDYAAGQIPILDAMDSDAFTPSLDTIDALMESIAFAPAG